jgi:serine protease DegQ
VRAPVLCLLAILLALLAACGETEGAGDTADVRTVTETVAAPAQVQNEDGTESSTDAETSGTFADIPDVVQEVEPSVVAIERDGGEGSGVIWSDEIVVTNNHVVEGASEAAVVFADGSRVDARVRATDRVTDLAILEVERSNLPEAEFADRLPRVGALAIAIGNPLGLENTVTAGIVSAVHRAIPGAAQGAPALVDLIQTDAAISPGNSGGALVDAAGRVIGINVAYLPPAARAVSIGFAIPAPTVVDVVEQLLEDGRAEHAFLGVEPAQLTPQIAEQFDVQAERGVIVLGVVERSAAEAAGVRTGDVIVSLDGDPLETVEDLLATLRRRSPGDTVDLRILRDGEELTVQATLQDRPS